MGSASTSSVPLREIDVDQLSALPINKAVQFQKALVGRRGAKQIDFLLRSIEISEDDKEQLRLLQVRVLRCEQPWYMLHHLPSRRERSLQRYQHSHTTLPHTFRSGFCRTWSHLGARRVAPDHAPLSAET